MTLTRRSRTSGADSEDHPISRAEKLRRHPFVRVDPDRVRVRAYFHAEARSKSGLPSDPLDDWLVAEDHELGLWLDEVMIRSSGSDVLLENSHILAACEIVRIGRHGDPPRYVGEAETRTCALCGRGKGEVTFKQRAHLLPEAFGNRGLLTLDECDECNAWSGRELDDHLGKMLLGDRVLAQIPTKSGSAAKAKLGEGRGSVGGTSTPRPLTVEMKEGDASVMVTPSGPNQLTISAPRVKFRPICALRSIGRMAYMALTRGQRQALPEFREWVLGVPGRA